MEIDCVADDDVSMAHHEAGHAVLQCAFGHAFSSVRVVGGDQLAYVQQPFSRPDYGTAETRRLREEIIVKYAGSLAA